jgi:hypothetical protein
MKFWTISDSKTVMFFQFPSCRDINVIYGSVVEPCYQILLTEGSTVLWLALDIRHAVKFQTFRNVVFTAGTSGSRTCDDI